MNFSSSMGLQKLQNEPIRLSMEADKLNGELEEFKDSGPDSISKLKEANIINGLG